MRSLGLNTIRLPVGWWYFAALSDLSAEPYLTPKLTIWKEAHPITQIIKWAKNAGLQVILTLEPVVTVSGSTKVYNFPLLLLILYYAIFVIFFLSWYCLFISFCSILFFSV